MNSDQCRQIVACALGLCVTTAWGQQIVPGASLIRTAPITLNVTPPVLQPGSAVLITPAGAQLNIGTSQGITTNPTIPLPPPGTGQITLTAPGGVSASGPAIALPTPPGSNPNSPIGTPQQTFVSNPGQLINWQTFAVGSAEAGRYAQPVHRTAATTSNAVAPGAGVHTGFLPSADVFQAITANGAYTIRALPLPANAATQAVMGADGVLRLSAKP